MATCTKVEIVINSLNEVNEPIILDLYEDNDLIDANSWQPLAFDYFVDISVNPFPQSHSAFFRSVMSLS